MGKNIYIIRHCQAEGQPAESPLTEQGYKQAIDLVAFFSKKKVERIISSPFLRAIQTIEPLAEKMNLEVVIDQRLSERILSTTQMPDWLERLEETYIDMDLKFEGGESSQEATERIVHVVDEILEGEYDNTIVVTHGGIMSLLLKSVDEEFGFKEWKKLSNPDVFILCFRNNEVTVERLWSEKIV
ncbi:histidine phosphatase family protein [Fredinandcohnia quinoae]|uniref:Histidine phosphatase family protein n=1 Tax=Fredinandcohnia quinoae TaxID=2918902 RepID=A0AAW5E1E8_9BACI|nr:histidine phosphatase family protein [Fredinandcohnia sp. SECRCQ15]MCH1626438.1 histidine phosphatase family protein [Fredinandcohnia sp. SECRCQ15]